MQYKRSISVWFSSEFALMSYNNYIIYRGLYSCTIAILYVCIRNQKKQKKQNYATQLALILHLVYRILWYMVTRPVLTILRS